MRATVTSALPPLVWQRSLDQRLVDEPDGEHDGYVWGVRRQDLYPGMRLVPDSAEVRRWSRDVGIAFHEAVIETDGHTVSLVFADLVVDQVAAGHTPFAVPGHRR